MVCFDSILFYVLFGLSKEADVLIYSLIVVVVIDGWDICIDNIGDAMRKAKVLDVALQDQVYDKLSKFAPRPSIYDPDFIAANQVTPLKSNKSPTTDCF